MAANRMNIFDYTKLTLCNVIRVQHSTLTITFWNWEHQYNFTYNVN